jgi:hypothetical protein
MNYPPHENQAIWMVRIDFVAEDDNRLALGHDAPHLDRTGTIPNSMRFPRFGEPGHGGHDLPDAHLGLTVGRRGNKAK